MTPFACPLVAAVLLDAAQRRVLPPARAWFERASAAAGPALEPRALAVAYAEAPRHLGRAALVLTPAERVALAAVGLTWSLAAWRTDDLARAAWLTGVAARASAHVLEALVDTVYARGDAGARGSVLRALPLLPAGARFIALALDAGRAATRPVLEAIACDNPFPAAHLHELHFNDLVMRAAAADLGLARVIGLEHRITPELVARARRLAADRRASGRGAPAGLARIIGGAVSSAA